MRTAITVGFWNGRYRRVLNVDGNIGAVEGLVNDIFDNASTLREKLIVSSYQVFRLPRKLGIDRYSLDKSLTCRYHSNGQRNRNVS